MPKWRYGWISRWARSRRECVPGSASCGRPWPREDEGYERTVGHARRTALGIGVHVRHAVPSLERGGHGGGADLRVRGVPAGNGNASPGHRLLRLVADRRAAPVGTAMGTPRAAHRGGNRYTGVAGVEAVR